MSGLDPITNYDTTVTGIAGKVSSRVWAEVHNPSSKDLSIRMLSTASMKSARKSQEKHAELKDFDSVQELKMAVCTLETAIFKVYPWNQSFKTLMIFLTNNNFGKMELQTIEFRLNFLVDFIDDVLASNAQAWDEQKGFLAHTELQAKWSASLAEKISLQAKPQRQDFAKKKGKSQVDSSKEGKPDSSRSAKVWLDKVPAGVCRNYNLGRCVLPDKHQSSWDQTYLLNHSCAKYLADKKRFCLGPHPLTEHK